MSRLSSNPQGFSRRDLFRRGGAVVGTELAALAADGPSAPVMRPPWALPEAEFIQRCSGCEACAKSCPVGVIAMENGLPQMNFSASGCDFCGDCARACGAQAPAEQGAALMVAAITSPSSAWEWTAEISQVCLSSQGVTCRMCGDLCPEGALRFRPALHGRSTPEVGAACTACGACIGVCPVQAISLSSLSPACSPR